MIDLFAQQIEHEPIKSYAERAYLNYAMYVILDRALPHIGDGLKPVQRRIIYAMSELGLKFANKHKKSARTIGDVLGKYHPHGDSACYEAMVLMAQAFSYRYPLIDGQGNWGSADNPKSFAAMRYTEARLAPLTEILLAELTQGTVDWVANFDGTLQEPQILPAQLPTLLLNGTTGIAVGMATDIPSHNLTEVAAACVYLLKHPKATTEEVCQFIQGPDLATRAEIITPKEDLLLMYKTGRGSFRARAVYEADKTDIIITALPYQVSGARVLEQIAQQMRKKKLPMLTDIRDESDHKNPTRLVLNLRSSQVDIRELMDHLFVTTDLEKNYRVNINVIGNDGRPKVKSLLEFIKEWLDFRSIIVRKRLEFRHEKILSRLHILSGLLIAYLNLDEVISIIRYEDAPQKQLIKLFHLTEKQAIAILDLKLRNLAKLEEQKLRSEQKDLEKECNNIETTLQSAHKFNTLVRKEIEKVAQKYGDQRRSMIVARPMAKPISEKSFFASEVVTVILSKKGWIRMAKGTELNPQALSYKSGDAFFKKATGMSTQSTLLLDESGRSYSVKTHTLPTARGHGEPITLHATPPANTQFVDLLLGNPNDTVVLASSDGYGFKTQLKNMQSKNKSGKLILRRAEKAKVLSPFLLPKKTGHFFLALVSDEPRLLIFPLSELAYMERGKGNKMMHFPSRKSSIEKNCLVSFAVLNLEDELKIKIKNRVLKLKGVELNSFIGKKGERGKKLHCEGAIKTMEVVISKF